MKRLLSTIACDARIQFRNGFYYAAAFLVVVSLLAFSQLPPLGGALAWLLPAIILNNLVLGTFYFAGGLVLLEKGEGTLRAQVVTPLRVWEYVASKVITLTALALVQNVILALLVLGLTPGVLPVAAGTALAAVLFVLAGLAGVARYESINEYLLPSVVYVVALLIPMLLYAGGWDSWLIYVHPFQAPLVLMRAAIEPVRGWQLAYGALYAALWIWLAYRLSRRAFRAFLLPQAQAA